MRNIAASVSQRLKNESRRRGRPFVDVLLHYAIERFLYRLGRSDYKDTFVLKGALAFYTFDANFPRPTRDIDFLGFTENEVDNLQSIVQSICETEVDEDDGIRFDLDTISGEAIKEHDEYSGVRLKFLAYLGKARIPMQIDVGFGDVVVPTPEYVQYPTILETSQAPVIKTYPLETIIAEKFQAIVKLYLVTSRLKDIYDIWFITANQTIDGATLCQALIQTFERRKTDLPHSIPDTYFEGFITSQNERQWNAIARKAYRIDQFPALSDALMQVREFLSLPCTAGSAHGVFAKTWRPNSGWTE